MTAPTASQIKAALDELTYPYPIQIFTYVPKFQRYPYITVRKTPPIQSEKNITTETTREGFEITLHIRYTKKQQDEEADQTTIEQQILDELDQIDFGTSALYMESKNWTRTAIPRIYGSQSRINVTVVDKSSVSGEGVLGSEMSLTLPSGDKVTILALSSTEGAQLDTHADDTAKNFRDFSMVEQGDFMMEYESQPTYNNEIKSISDTGDNVNVTLVKGDVTRNLSVLFGQISKRGQFDTIERSTTKFTVQAEFGTQIRVSQFSVDAIIE